MLFFHLKTLQHFETRIYDYFNIIITVFTFFDFIISQPNVVVNNKLVFQKSIIICYNIAKINAGGCYG